MISRPLISLSRVGAAKSHLVSPGRNNPQFTTLGRAYDPTEARKWLQFTCSHQECKQDAETDRIVRKTISTLAYEKGVVLVRCPCDKLHLIADRLGWFENGGTDIEQIAKLHGIKFEKGTIEFDPTQVSLEDPQPVDKAK